MNLTTSFMFAFVIIVVKGTDDYIDSSEADERSTEAETITKRNSKLDESEITLIERSGENIKADTILSGMETLKESPLVLRTPDLSRESTPMKTDETLLEGRSNEPAPELTKSVQKDDKAVATDANPEVEEGVNERVANNFEDDKTTTKAKIEGKNAEEQEKTEKIESKSSDEPMLDDLENRRMMSDTEDLAIESKAAPHTEIEGKSGQTHEETMLRFTPHSFSSINNCCGKKSKDYFIPSRPPIPLMTNPFSTTNIIPKSINPVTNSYNPPMQNLFNPRNELRSLREMTTLKREMINAFNEYPFGTATTVSLDRLPFKLKQGFPTEQRKLFEHNNEKYFKSFPRLPLPTYQPPRAPFLYTFLPVV